MRTKWYPSNGSDGMYLQDYCADCLHDINEDCPLILQSLTADGKDEMPDEWTADDIYGRGFECSKKQPLPAAPPNYNIAKARYERPVD